MSKKTPLPDCLSCGACCVAPRSQDAFCDVSAEDLERLGRGWVKKNVLFSSPFDRLVSMIDGNQVPLAAIATKWTEQKSGPLKGHELCSCVALKGSVMNAVKCSVYEKRPETCKTAVVPGDRNCLDLRRAFKDAIEERS